ncbi:MAG: 3-oxoacyl-ACP reductase FabG [Smithellaceae bacterium]|jgi:3-oxoacyl-[acyl-carrier protein] reductase|nr:3-oxoacyl-ACP reductase FabG [Smithellaceae bacterium]MDD5413687.1 3-oxoacyl-ACP reductase FabG [Smithellaceae bacterium]HBJ74237.1 3-oxoacyl-ACP reductase FabG [Syntrophaceae bacterium]HCX02337.1 3-oxoacyl-ACP reductase FabG [Syntrophaceae bacterium]
MDEKIIALVTGASRGIGRATAVELARAGYYVVINYNASEAAASQTLTQIQASGAAGEIRKFDVANAAQVKEALAGIIEEHKRIDVLVNNAGVTRDGLFLMMGEEDWHTVINTTLNGFYNVTKPVLREMIRKKRGAIVSVSSISSLVPNRGQANYAAAKAGINAATSSLAKEVARFGIRVNAVAPGPIDTDMLSSMPMDANTIKSVIPMARLGKPEEVARVIRFLCSDDASYITGQVISVNGGMF